MYHTAKIRTGTGTYQTFAISGPNFMAALREAQKIVARLQKNTAYRVTLVELLK